MLAYLTTGGVNVLVFVIAVFTFGLKVFALADAALRPTNGYLAAGKLTKLKWCGILGVALLVNLVVGNPLSFLNIIGDIAAILYLVDVRPALRELGPGGAIGGRGGRGGGGGGPSGW